VNNQIVVLIGVVSSSSWACGDSGEPPAMSLAARILTQSWNGLPVYAWIALLIILAAIIVAIGLGIVLWKRRQPLLVLRTAPPRAWLGKGGIERV